MGLIKYLFAVLILCNCFLIIIKAWGTLVPGGKDYYKKKLFAIIMNALNLLFVTLKS